MPTRRALLFLALLLTSSAQAQSRSSAPPSAFEGVWNRIESKPTASNTAPTPTGPGLMLFVDGHYSWIYINGTTGRPPVPGPNGTAAQLRAVYDAPIVAEAGTYEVTGQTMTRRRSVSKNPAVMQPGIFVTYSWRLAGDSLWVGNIATDAGPVATPNQNLTKYVRLRGSDAGALRGAWSHLEVRRPDGTLMYNQPGLRLFVDGYFAWVRVNGLAPRAPVDSTATAAQLRAVWGDDAFLGSAGTYSVIGNIIVQSSIVAMNPAAMQPGLFNSYSFRIAGDTLISTNHGSQAGGIAAALNVGKYVRVRGPSVPTN